MNVAVPEIMDDIDYMDIGNGLGHDVPVMNLLQLHKKGPFRYKESF